MSKELKVNINSVDNFSSDLKKKSDDLLEIIEYLLSISKDMDNFYDTPESKVLNEGMIKYLNNAKLPCYKLGDLAYKVKLFSQNYSNVYNDISRSVGENNEVSGN